MEAVVRALAHPLLGRAAAAARAGRCRREAPIAIRLTDGVLVEGLVDAALLEDEGGWTVLDFKTDVEIAAQLEQYGRQVGLYAQAIERVSLPTTLTHRVLTTMTQGFRSRRVHSTTAPSDRNPHVSVARVSTVPLVAWR